MSTKMYVAVFKKTFLTGIFKGLTVDATCSYPNREGAQHHIDCIKQGVHSDLITGSQWEASDCRVVPLSKMPMAHRARHGLV